MVEELRGEGGPVAKITDRRFRFPEQVGVCGLDLAWDTWMIGKRMPWLRTLHG